MIHLRARTNTIGAAARVRHHAFQAAHAFLDSQDFIQVHCPVITSNDCEGAGELFSVESAAFLHSRLLPGAGGGGNDANRPFFPAATGGGGGSGSGGGSSVKGTTADSRVAGGAVVGGGVGGGTTAGGDEPDRSSLPHLTVSSQLEAEVYASAMSRVCVKVPVLTPAFFFSVSLSSFSCSFVRSLFLNACTHSFIFSFVEFVHACRHVFMHSFSQSFIQSLIHSFIHSFVRSFVHSSIHSFIHSCIHSFVRSFVCVLAGGAAQVQLRAVLPCGELAHHAPPGRVLDARAGGASRCPREDVCISSAIGFTLSFAFPLPTPHYRCCC